MSVYKNKQKVTEIDKYEKHLHLKDEVNVGHTKMSIDINQIELTD
jgi:hypothetical protein